MADGAVIVGVTAVLTSGVVGPMVLHQMQKDRDDRSDVRAALDAAAEALATARAHDVWISSFAFDDRTPSEQIKERIVAMLEQAHIVAAHAPKLEIRYPDSELAGAYEVAGTSLIGKTGAVLRRAYGITPNAATYNLEREGAEREYLAAYTRFVQLASRVVADL
jgi:hypothetical protein